ncbi:hypothetical protein [Butyrivibrio sp. VCB2006]|uniref:hypothetical protein n=1 Tax=Butyrivibrio sp. VCB2006 TaxID=1280679 RepID=UPI0003F65FA4|nr:hypothetical protein [Butyrivibrio sp. VCB2006]
MAYSSGGRLPFESASKLGHLNVIESEWVQSLLKDFETNDVDNADNYENDIWENFDPSSAQPLNHIWAADGSYVSVEENHKELAFVKTALMTVEQGKIAAIDKEYPHPLKLQEIMKDSALFHATVFPLRNLKSDKGNIYDTVRHVIYDSMRTDENGQYFETLKWLAYKKWDGQKNNSLSFECPHCSKVIENGIPYDQDTGVCPHCHKEVLLTDMIGFHLDMNEENASDSVASHYMLIMEMLMLFTVIRLQWANKDTTLISDTLFIKDGPMTLNGQYSKLVPNIREFLNYAKNQGRPIHIIGSEKSGSFFEYLSLCSRFVKPDPGNIKYAVLSHGYIRRVIQRAPDRGNPYGLRTNWGEKVFVYLDENTHMVLNMTTGGYDRADSYPTSTDIIGLQRILATLPALVSRKYEGALYPIELVNGIASMSNYPSAKILQDFVRDAVQ